MIQDRLWRWVWRSRSFVRGNGHTHDATPPAAHSPRPQAGARTPCDTRDFQDTRADAFIRASPSLTGKRVGEQV